VVPLLVSITIAIVSPAVLAIAIGVTTLVLGRRQGGIAAVRRRLDTGGRHVRGNEQD
jgi:hypothetical protein